MSIAHAVLGVLIESDCHGYEIAQVLAERTGGEPYNTGQIHQALEQLERRGWAHSRPTVGTSRFRRPCTSTPVGRAEFQSWMDRPVPLARPLRDEVLLKVVFVGERDRGRVVELLHARRHGVLESLATADRKRRAQEPAADRRGRLAGLASDALRFRLEAELRWVEHCLTALRPPVLAPGAEETGEIPPPVPIQADLLG
jgi:DNA-binding PadR family transcriptional regulator